MTPVGLASKIAKLDEFPPVFVRFEQEWAEKEAGPDPRSVWYRSQREHWLGWLREYGGPGAYGRIVGLKRDAEFAYNHVVNPAMLIWLGEASGVPVPIVQLCRS